MKLRLLLTGLCTGLLNGLFGAGGGLLAVPLLQKCGLPPQNAHATSIAVTLPLSAISAGLLLFSGIPADLPGIFLAVAAGIPGAWIGAKLLERIRPALLKRIFGGVMVVSALRLFFR